MTELRACKQCGEEKSLTAFYRSRGNSGDDKWRMHECSTCVGARTKEWKANNKDRARLWNKVSEQNFAKKHGITRSGLWFRNNPEKRMLAGAKRRAKIAGLEFNIDVTDIVIPEVCPILGIKLVFNIGKSGSDNSPALDRINNDLGYVKGNVAVISHLANRLKSNWSAETIRALIQYTGWKI